MDANLKKAINAFCNALTRNGVSEDQIRSSLAQVMPALRQLSEIIQAGYAEPEEAEPLTAVTNGSNRRSDFLGRAMMAELERFLPSDQDEAKLITKEPVNGRLPRQVFQGVITAIKNSQSFDKVEQYERICADKVKNYMMEDGKEVDLEAFMSDPEVRQIVSDMINGMRSALQRLEEEVQRQWLFNVISNAPSLKNIDRELSSQEFNLLENFLLSRPIQ